MEFRRIIMNETIQTDINQIIDSVEKILSDGKVGFSDIPEVLKLLTKAIKLIKDYKNQE